MSEQRKYRKFTAQQKTEFVLASLKGHKTIAELGRGRDIFQTLLRRWREQFLAAGAHRMEGKAEHAEVEDMRKQTQRLERTLGKKTLELEISGELLRDGSDSSASPVPASWSPRDALLRLWRALPVSPARRSIGGRRGRRRATGGR